VHDSAEDQIFRADFSHCVGSSRCLVAGVSSRALEMT
jgi:hypothetical protein